VGGAEKTESMRSGSLMNLKQKMSTKTKRFGPFKVPVDQLIEKAGFRCDVCAREVRKSKLDLPLADQ
jgi:hypothetical protein